MKERTFVALLILVMLPVLVLPLFDTADGPACGSIRIPAAGLTANVYYIHQPQTCGCCGMLWNGGQVDIKEDVSAVRIYDVADMTTIDGTHHVLECVEIVSCIRVGRWLIGWSGVLRTNGDVLLCTSANRWPFVRVLRLTRL